MVRRGDIICIGIYAIIGLAGNHILPPQIIQFLHGHELFILVDIGCQLSLISSSSSWPHAENLALLMELNLKWENYRCHLYHADIALINREDVHSWCGLFHGGEISTKEAYKYIYNMQRYGKKINHMESMMKIVLSLLII